MGPQHLLVTLGYAGWSEGQLEQELADNAWLSVPASEHILFELPAEERLPAAMALLGIDFAPFPMRPDMPDRQICSDLVAEAKH